MSLKNQKKAKKVKNVLISIGLIAFGFFFGTKIISSFPNKIIGWIVFLSSGWFLGWLGSKIGESIS